MSVAQEEFEKILKDVFRSPTVPWDKVRTVKIDWKRVNVGSDEIREGHLGFWRKFVVVPVVKITMKNPI